MDIGKHQIKLSGTTGVPQSLLEDSDSFLTTVTAFRLELKSISEHALKRHQVYAVIIDTKDSLFTKLGAACLSFRGRIFAQQFLKTILRRIGGFAFRLILHRQFDFL